MLDEIEQVKGWVEGVKASAGENTPIRDKDIFAGIFVMVLSEIEMFREDAKKESDNSQEFWEQLGEEFEALNNEKEGQG